MDRVVCPDGLRPRNDGPSLFAGDLAAGRRPPVADDLGERRPARSRSSGDPLELRFVLSPFAAGVPASADGYETEP
jgi:hypothetical protein